MKINSSSQQGDECGQAAFGNAGNTLMALASAANLVKSSLRLPEASSSAVIPDSVAKPAVGGP